jgi:hypothetical protein
MLRLLRFCLFWLSGSSDLDAIFSLKTWLFGNSLPYLKSGVRKSS